MILKCFLVRKPRSWIHVLKAQNEKRRQIDRCKDSVKRHVLSEPVRSEKAKERERERARERVRDDVFHQLD